MSDPLNDLPNDLAGDLPDDAMQSLFALADLYLAGELEPAGVAQLEQMLLDDDANAQALIAYMRQAGMMREVFSEQAQFQSRIGEASRDEYLAMLQSLRPTHPVDAVELARGSGFVLGQGRSGQRGMKSLALVFGGIAAAIVLAGLVGLVVRLASAPSNPQNPLAQSPGNSGSSVIEQREPADRPVATLTAEQGARWRVVPGTTAPSVGDALRANQTLTLTQGFAEVTTARGAIAILEAPCTIEMIDSPNALRLVHGRLVGICETEPSRGFLVRTPHMDITDLGTRFGVDASTTGITEVHVFEGEVALQGVGDTGPRRVILRAGSALQAPAGARSFIAIDVDQTRFAANFNGQDPTLPADAARAGITGMAGDIMWSSFAPAVIEYSQWPAAEHATIHRELMNHRLRADVAVTQHLPGIYTSYAPGSPSASIPQGTAIRSYLIAFKPRGADFMTSAGRITFEGEIVGVIADASTWDAFVDVTLDHEPVFRMPQRNQGGTLDGRGAPSSDTLEIEPDGRTLSFEFQSRQYIDFFRVIVREPAGDRP